MKAKFVYETIGDILKGRSEEDILSSMENSRPNDLLFKLIEAGFLPGVKKALEMGADIHANDDYALRWASYSGHSDIVELLLKNGADIHADFDFALRYASDNGHLPVVELLLKNGADVHAKNDSPLRWASEKGHCDITKLLNKYI
jgi:ankyrin repeat protein